MKYMLFFSMLISLSGCKDDAHDLSWIPDSLISESTSPVYSIIKGSKCLPKLVKLSENTPAAITLMVEDVISEINEIAGIDFVRASQENTSALDSHCSDMVTYLNTSEYKHTGGIQALRNIYINHLGIADLDLAVSYGFPNALENVSTAPCFMLNIYSAIDFRNAGSPTQYMEGTNPSFQFIQIGYYGVQSDSELKHCLREEIAHAIFFIPDRYQTDNNETIFNIADDKSSTNNFSRKDKILMRFLATNQEVIGMNHTSLVNYIEKVNPTVLRMN